MRTFVLIAALAACQQTDKPAASKEPVAKSPPKATPKASGANATVSIKVTGVIQKTLSGPIGFCAIPMIGGKESGASFQVSDGDIQISIVAASASEMANPKIALHTQTASYLLMNTIRANLVAGTSAEIDAVLEGVSPTGKVFVTGTITCD